MTIPDSVQELRDCLDTIKQFRKLRLPEGGTTATEDRIAAVLPGLLDELLRLRADQAARARRELESVRHTITHTGLFLPANTCERICEAIDKRLAALSPPTEPRASGEESRDA